MNKRYGLMLIALVAASLSSTPAFAQGGFQAHMKQNQLDKARFYNSPRQVQILDERPIIKDFREAPAASPQIALPPGPQGGMGGYGGNGAGALGDVPSGGPGGGNPIQLGGPGVQPYRTQNPNQPGGLPLPKSGFMGPSNIPAGGIGPKQGLQDGTTTNRLMGKMMTPKQPISMGGGPSGALGRGGGPRKVAPAAAPAASYGANYGAPQSSGTGYGGGNKTEGLVRGTLLNKLK